MDEVYPTGILAIPLNIPKWDYDSPLGECETKHLQVCVQEELGRTCT
jgi:hypothetical protein